MSSNPKHILRLEKRAASGDAHALTKLVQIYDEGDGVRKSKRKVLECLRKGADISDPYLTWCLADSLYHGVYGDDDIDGGLAMYRRAAKLGVAAALSALGSHFFNCGGAANQKLAAKYYREAAKSDQPQALYNLSLMHESGTGVRKSLKMAIDLLLRAAMNGSDGAQYKIGRLLLTTPETHSEGKRWLRKASKQGHYFAKKLLASTQQEPRSTTGV